MKLLIDAWYANEVRDWLIAFGVACAALIGFALLERLAVRLLSALSRRTSTTLDDDLTQVARGTRIWLLFPLALYLGSLTLELPQRLDNVIVAIATIALLVQAAVWVNRFIQAWVAQQVAARRADGDTITALGLLGFLGKVVMWVLIVLLILDQLNFDITALVAGLGIGGVAVALAVQNILGDLFASFSILLDKPFVVGDFIVVGDEMGTVEEVGVKTTRVRALSGELIIFSNADLLKSRIRNMRRQYERRAVFSFGLVYDTTPDKIRRALDIVREAIARHKGTRFERAHFKDYGASALNFEVVYFVADPNFNLYMDIQQAVNLAMLEKFAADGIEFAYPTQVVHLTGKLAHEPETPPTDARREETPTPTGLRGSGRAARGTA